MTDLEQVSDGPRLYTAGYGNLPPDRFFASLRDRGIDLAVDIRHSPWGRLNPFQGARFLENLRIRAYIPESVHKAELGNRAFKTGGMDIAPEGMDWLAGVIRRGITAVILCGCGKPWSCHRRVVSDEMAFRLPELRVTHIGYEGQEAPPRQPESEQLALLS